MPQLEIRQPADNTALASVAIDSPESVAATVARVRANQPAWEALGIEGRYRWLGRLRDWLLDNSDRVLDTMQSRRPARCGADAANEPAYLADLINFYGTNAAKFIGEESDPAARARCWRRRSCGSSTGPTPSSASSAPGTSR